METAYERRELGAAGLAPRHLRGEQQLVDHYDARGARPWPFRHARAHEAAFSVYRTIFPFSEATP